jgi:glycosyltransferase 2 family protein
MQQAATPSGGGPPVPAAVPADRAPPPEPAGRKPPAPASHSPAPAPPDGQAIQVEDDLQPRVRMPADLLRCILTGLELVLIAGVSLLGVQVSASSTTRRLPTGIGHIIGLPADIAVLALPLALAVLIAVNGGWRRLLEAVATAGLVVGVVAALNVVLRLDAFSLLYNGLAAPPHNGARPPLFDAYLAGLVAFITVIGLASRPQWRTAIWIAISFYSLTTLAYYQTTVLALLMTMLIGSTIGSGLRFAVGTVSERPPALKIATALASAGTPVTAIRRIFDSRSDNRRYLATTTGGQELDVSVFDRDQQAVDVLYRIYRFVRLRSTVSRSSPLTMERAVERQSLLIYATEDAGVATPRLRALLRVGSEAAVLACERRSGTTLARLSASPTDEQLKNVWAAVLRLHEHRVTHRALTADRILLTGPQCTDVILLDPGNGDVAATELQLRLDLAQLLAELALLVGPGRAVDIAMQEVGPELPAIVPLLQPVALHRSTRAALRRRKDVLPALRKRLTGDAPGDEIPQAQLERFRLRTIITLVVGVVAADILVSQLSKEKFGTLVSHLNWGWGLIALALSIVTYIGATFSLTGFVLEKLSLVKTFLAQLAGTFVALVTPVAVGGVALNIRFLRKSGVASADAAASVGVSQVFAFALHILLLIVFVTITGTSHQHSLAPHAWVFIALGALVAAALLVLVFPAGRRLVQSRLAPAISQVVPRLLDVAQRPAKLTQGIGGALLVTGGYILCLDASVRALGGTVSLPAVAVVYLTGNAIATLVPTPGGLGAVEAALSAGLTAAGLPGTTAVSAVLLFRTLTFWLPVAVGWFAMHYLQARDAL